MVLGLLLGFAGGAAYLAFAHGKAEHKIFASGLVIAALIYLVWRILMRTPRSAAHALGKLFLAVGENNVLWGTDSIWYGSPQDQIQAFRAFQISDALIDAYAYPQLTPELRAKVFGLNAMKPYYIHRGELPERVKNDAVAEQRRRYREAANPHFMTYGPKTRREFLNLLRAQS